jgi:hypothetical protein
LFKAEEGENFDPGNTWRMLRVNPPKFGGRVNVDSGDQIGQKGAFYQGLVI